MRRTSMPGGVYTFAKEAFGRDHAFLSAWFLCLSYLTIVFLNGTALFFVVRTLFGGMQAHIAKPIDVDKLLGALEEVLRGQSFRSREKETGNRNSGCRAFS